MYIAIYKFDTVIVALLVLLMGFTIGCRTAQEQKIPHTDSLRIICRKPIDAEFKIARELPKEGDAIILKGTGNTIFIVTSVERKTEIGMTHDLSNLGGSPSSMSYTVPDDIKEKINLPFTPGKTVVIHNDVIAYPHHIKQYPNGELMIGVSFSKDAKEPDTYIKMEDIKDYNK